MLKGLFILIILPLLLMAAPAQAETTLTGPAVKPWMVRCLAGSHVPTPSMTITVTPSAKPGRSTVAPWRALITTSARGNRAGCQTLMHEIGHIYDWTTLTANKRQSIACSIFRESSANPWWGYYQSGRYVAGGEGIDSPMERFAEAYALVAVYKSVGRGASWLDDVEYASYGLDRYFDRQRFLSLRNYLRQLAPSGDNRVRDQRQPLSRCL